MTKLLHHDDGRLTIVLSDTMSEFLDGKAVISLSAEENENLERHANKYLRENTQKTEWQPHELAEIFGDAGMDTHLKEEKVEIGQELEALLENDRDIKVTYGKISQRNTLDLKEWGNERRRQLLLKRQEWINRVLSFCVGKGGKKKLMDFNLAIAKAKEYPISELLVFNKNKALCIWHDERSASLHYYKKNNTVWCFSCGRGGDSLDVVMQQKGCSLKEALSFLN